MTGLSMTDAAAASLLLTLEGVATALMAWFVFRENFDARVALGMGCLVAGALVLSWTGKPTFSGLLGPLAIVGACVAWGSDNNLTRKVSLSDPLQIVQFKGLIAGPFLLALGLLAGTGCPPLRWQRSPEWSASSAMASASRCSCWPCDSSVQPGQAPTSQPRRSWALSRPSCSFASR